MSRLIRVLERNGSPYVYDEETALPQEGDWVEVTQGTSIIKHTWHEEVPEETQAALKIRKITKRSFMQRLTQAERIDIRNSVDDIVIDIHEDLKISSNVDLDIPEIEQALLYFVAVGILVETRIVELLVDGTEAEAYRGI